MMFAVFAHCFNLYVIEVSCWLKSGVDIDKLVGPFLNRSLHAMHDSGCFHQKDLEKMFGQIFRFYKKAELMSLLGTDDMYNETLVSLTLGLPDNRIELVKNTLRKTFNEAFSV